MELRQLAYAVAVADEGTFTAAARSCHVVQSALSHQIARLETELGATLFERTSRSLTITAAGHAFLPCARRALAAVEQARADVVASAGVMTGPLRIGAIPTLTALGLAAEIAEFRSAHPHIEVKLAAGTSGDLVDQVRDGALDVAFIGVAPDYVARGVAERELAVEQLAALVPETEGRSSVRLADLSEVDFVDFARGTAARRQTDLAFEKAGVSRQVAYEVGTTEFAEDFVSRGLGVALVPAGYRVRADLRLVPIVDPPLRSQRVVWATSPTPVARAFLGVIGINDAATPELNV